MEGRGEERGNAIVSNGEAYIQRAVLGGARDARLRFFDIGANQGDWTLTLLAQLRSAPRAGAISVELFEPVPTTLARLKANLAAVATPVETHVNALALSDVAGTATMAIFSETGGTNSLHFHAVDEAAPKQLVEVETTTLDGFCGARDIDRIHLVKCDAEGHDLSVIRGAAGMLAAGAVDVLQFEYNHRWIYGRAFLKDVFDLIDALPYRIGRIRPDCVELFAAWRPEIERYFQSNYVIVHERALGWFDARPGDFDAANTYVGAQPALR